MERIEAIKNIMDTVSDEIVVTSCGHISRETFHVKDRPENFYVMGSMGCSLPIAMGVALAKPNKKVISIIGDGEALMGLDSLVLLQKLQRIYENKGLDMARPYIQSGNVAKANNILTENKFNLQLYILDNGMYGSTGGQESISDAVCFRLLCDCKVIFVKESKLRVPRIKLCHKEIKERFMDAIKN